jgi:hypothetical protein
MPAGRWTLVLSPDGAREAAAAAGVVEGSVEMPGRVTRVYRRE